MNVAILVTHLLGTGHLRRAVTLAKAFGKAGHTPTVISGGDEVTNLDTKGLHLVQLPSLHSDGTNFAQLLDDANKPATPALLASRITAITEALDKARPSTLITELFPFGRRVLQDEFMAAITHARSLPHPPKTYASVRDILAPPSKPAKAELTEQRLHAYYHGVLVHSDESTTPLEASWPISDALKPMLHYTGYVAPAPAAPHPQSLGKDEIIVSAGGGAVGEHVFRTALKAASQDTSRVWRLLIGGGNSALLKDLQSNAQANTIIEPTRPDFRQMLHHAACSVSLCGYNTALDLMQARCKGVFIPFDDGGEVEQTLRAKSLADRPEFEMIASKELTPDRLLDTLSNLIKAPKPDRTIAAIDGAAQTVRIIERLAT